MTDPAALAPQGVLGYVQLAAGSLLLLAPGAAAVDRFLGVTRRSIAFAPVFAFTLLPLTAIALDLVLQVPVTPLATALEAAAWVLLLEWPRRRQVLAWAKSPRLPRWRPRVSRPTLWKGAAVLAVLGGVALVQSLPHLPGPGANVLTAYPGLASRAAEGLVGTDYPFPVHVDEHYHLSHQAAIERQGHIAILDPYDGKPQPTPLFSVEGFRDERGFDVAMAQAHQLTGLSLPAQARLAPAVQSAVLAAVLYAALWPAPGALASAALVALLPTTVRFLGPAFLVPSAFALPWILAALHVSLRATGGRRLAALALLETAGFFLHLVIGTLVLATAAGASLARPGRLVDRITLAAVCFLPLLWIGPLVTDQVALAVAQENELPFQTSILFAGGGLALVAALGGAAIAALLPDEEMRPHRVLLALGVAIAFSVLMSIRTGHHSDATYSRLIPTLYVCVAALAGLAAGWTAGQGRRWLRRPNAWFLPAATSLLVLLVAAPAVADHLSTPYYRIFDGESWTDARILAGAGVEPGASLLCDPWRAPLYNTVSGALVPAVLIPGRVPEHQADWDFYLRSRGANETWLRERSIGYVVAPFAPNAPHVGLGGNVYRLNATADQGAAAPA
jgi:hypothetical protein